MYSAIQRYTRLIHYFEYRAPRYIPMSTEIAKVLDQLRLDHRNMDVLLQLLDRESNQIYAAEPVDFERMRDVMLYMTTYPDTVHHPKEDELYAELRAVRPDLSQGMSRITKEHHDIAQQGQSVREMIDAILSGDLVKRNTVVRDTLRYVTSLRAHMHWEESDLFRRIDKMVSDGHEFSERATIISRVDPVFGKSVEKKFSKLFDSIKAANMLA